MKALLCIITFFITFFGLFLLFSTAGLIWTSYYDTIMDKAWFAFYTLFIGWWMAALVVSEVYEQLYES